MLECAIQLAIWGYLTVVCKEMQGVCIYITSSDMVKLGINIINAVLLRKLFEPLDEPQNDCCPCAFP